MIEVDMRRTVAVAAIAALAISPFVVGGAASSASPARPSAPVTKAPLAQPVGGAQHFCGSNGITCADPATTWDELAGYKDAVAKGAKLQPYIGHDEPETQFFSNRAGTGNNVSYTLQLPKDPPTLPKQDGSGGTFNFQDHITFWFSIQ